MPISDVNDAIGMTYEDAVSLNLSWNGSYPLIEGTSHLIKRIIPAAEADQYVHVNVLADGNLQVMADGDGYDAVVLHEEAARLGLV